jgi:hypothetical protein
VRNRAQALIMMICATGFFVGAVLFTVLQLRQSAERAELRNDGVEAAVEWRSFIERDERRLNPNTGRYDTYSDDRVEFGFRLGDGAQSSATQPIAADRYAELGALDELSVLYMPDDPDGAELLDNGEFVANTVPFWAFAALCAALAACAGGIAYSSSRRPAEVAA